MNLRDCRVNTTLKVIRGKWKPLIIKALNARCCLGYGELRRVLPEARKKVLTEQLRQLEEDRVVTRTVLLGKIVRVQYALTAYGHTLIPILTWMDDWGQKHKQFLASVHPQDCPRQRKAAFDTGSPNREIQLTTHVPASPQLSPRMSRPDIRM